MLTINKNKKATQIAKFELSADKQKAVQGGKGWF